MSGSPNQPHVVGSGPQHHLAKVGAKKILLSKMNGNMDGSGRKHLQSMVPLASNILWHACCIGIEILTANGQNRQKTPKFCVTFGCGTSLFVSLEYPQNG